MYIALEFLIVHSLTCAKRINSAATNCIGAIDANKWFKVNLDPHKSTFVSSFSDIFEVTSDSSSVTMTTTGTLDSSIVGRVVTMPTSRLGVVLSVTSGNTLTFSTDAAFTVGERKLSLAVTRNLAGAVLSWFILYLIIILTYCSFLFCHFLMETVHKYVRYSSR